MDKSDPDLIFQQVRDSQTARMIAEQGTPEAHRMILAVGDFDAGRIAPEDIKRELIDHSALTQPQHDLITGLYRSGIFAYNGTDIPELTESGREAYNALDASRDAAERPPVIEYPTSATLPEKRSFFGRSNDQSSTRDSTEGRSEPSQFTAFRDAARANRGDDGRER